jgi:membrane-bound lytic murein transglycosylase D
MMLRTHLLAAGLFSFSALVSTGAQATGRNEVHGVRPLPNAVASTTADAAESTLSIPPAESFPSDGVHSPETDARIAKADSHFNAGRQLYFQGNLSGAHREFDAAVDSLLTAPDSLPDHRRIERRLDEICDLIYRFDIEKLGAGQAEDEAVVFDKAPIDEISHMTFAPDQKLSSQLQSELHQIVSGIPLELSDPVLGYVHYFSTENGRRTLLAGFKRAGRYRPMIERILAEEGVPQELLYLAQAESAFLPRALSNKQAVGMWQFIAETGTTFNLNRTANYDERLDPEKSTRAAARYLKSLYQRYGDWYLAMAAYNCGAGSVDRAVERTGYADYWELLKRKALPHETSNYVPIILAITIIAKNPQDYGLDRIDSDDALTYDTIRLTANTNLNLIADATMEPLSEIRDLNPALLNATAPSGFEIHVPKGAGDSTQAALELVPAQNREAWRIHHVQAGDTLAAIAKNYSLAPERILAVNSQGANLSEGDTLLIPAVYHEPAARTRKTARRSSAAISHAPAHSVRTTVPQRNTHVAAARRVPIPAQVLHRKAVVHTASLRQ